MKHTYQVCNRNGKVIRSRFKNGITEAREYMRARAKRGWYIRIIEEPTTPPVESYSIVDRTTGAIVEWFTRAAACFAFDEVERLNEYCHSGRYVLCEQYA